MTKYTRVPFLAGCHRWIEAEREEALLGKGAEKREGGVRHVEEAYLAFGAGPRVCPGQVRKGWRIPVEFTTFAAYKKKKLMFTVRRVPFFFF